MKRASLCTAMRRRYDIRDFLLPASAKKRSLPEAVVETGEEMRDGFFGFVAHIREAEGLAFDLAVAAVDDEVMFFAKISHELGDVDAAVVFHAGERDRAKIFFGKKFESALANPIVN